MAIEEYFNDIHEYKKIKSVAEYLIEIEIKYENIS